MIRIQSLTKRYGNHTAVSNLTFTVEKGRIYGFLGPNGAGKSTTMNIIAGCLAATEGSVSVDGFDIYEDELQAKSRIGYLPEQPPLYPDMTPGEYLCFVAKAKGLRGAAVKTEAKRVMEATGITAMQNRLISHLSKGYKQRVGIAQALIADPPVIILDEPTIGLDPQQIIQIRNLIRSLGGKHTVILSSHILGEVSAVCDEILVISKGQLVAQDTPKNLEARFTGAHQLELTVRAPREKVKKILSSLAAVTVLDTKSEKSDHTTVHITAEENISEAVSNALMDARIPVLSMTETHATLEDAFLKLTEAEEPQETIVEEEEAQGNESDI